MTLTLNDNWKERAARDSYEERFIVSITKGSTTWEAVNAQCSAFSKAVAVVSVDPLAAEMDVKTRQLQIDGNTVVFDRDWIRDLVRTERLRGAKLRIRHGFVDLAESDFVEYWTGVIEGVFPESTDETDQGVVRVEGLNVLEILRQTKITGSWIQEHPLDAIYNILAVRVALDSSLIDASAFDPDAAEYDEFSHLVGTRSDVTRFHTDGGVREPTPALDLIDELAMLVNGTLYVTDEGKISFRAFDPDAAAADTWTEDVYDEVSQISLDDDLINRVEFNFMPEEQAAYFTYLNGQAATYGVWNGAYVANDTDSQSVHAYPGTSTRIITHKTESPWVGAGYAMVGTTDTNSDGINASVTSFILFGGPVPTFCGTRESSSGTGSQPANAQISSARPLYLLTDTGEIIKATSMTTRLDNGTVINVVDDETGVVTPVGPYHFRFDISGVTRGALGTTPAAAVKVVDITVQQYLAAQLLKRHGNGIAKVELNTGLEQWDKEIGDLVYLEWDGYLGYGIDGIETADGKWEIIKKEHSPETMKIKWVLASATVGTPTTTQRGRQRLRDRTIANVFEDSAENEDIFKRHIVTGFAVTPVSGLQISIAAGVASAGITRTKLRQAITTYCKANKDNYVFFDVGTGTVQVVYVDHDATSPYSGFLAVLLAVVRTNSTEVTGIVTDSQPTKAIDGGKLVDASVGGTQIATGGVGTQNLANGAATGDKIASGAVSSPHVKKSSLSLWHQTTPTNHSNNMFKNGQMSSKKKTS